MSRLLILIAALVALAAPALADPQLVRVVIVLRHGIRPPTQSNDALAKYADQPWPAWPVAPGELTPHGGANVLLVSETVAAAYRKAGLLAAGACAPAGQVSVWADNIDERTRDTGRIFAVAIQPGCDLETRWSAATARDPIFSGTDQPSCAVDADKLKAATVALADDPPPLASLAPAVARLQAILAPNACSGGAGTCFTAPPAPAAAGAAPPTPAMVLFPNTAALSEDLMLEYVDGKPMSQVGWGRASRADVIAVMAIHEHAFALVRDNAYLADRKGAPMARIILAALAGQPVGGGPQSGPDTKLLAVVGHDSNLAWMAGVFGLNWTFPDIPDFTAPATTLAFELWSDGGKDYVRPVIYWQGLDQMRSASPDQAEATPLTFKDCASGPMDSCPLDQLRQRVLAALPGDCGTL